MPASRSVGFLLAAIGLVLVCSQRMGDVHAAQKKRDKMQFLYVHRCGKYDQLRLRTLPYPGSEMIIWDPGEARVSKIGGPWILRYAPSPGYTRVAVTTSMPDAVVVVPLDGGPPDTIHSEQSFGFALWESDRVVSLFGDGGSVWRYDVKDHSLTLSATNVTPEAFLAPAFSSEHRRLDQIIRSRTITVPFPDHYSLRAVLNAAGFSLSLPDIVRLPLVAVSPDGEYLALSGQAEDAVLIFSWLDEGAVVRRSIPLTRVVEGEGTWVSGLRWSDDSQFLTFTEVHYHPARFYANDAPEKPDPLDWTPLVRMYSVSEDRTTTILVGSNGWIIPEAAAGTRVPE